MTITERAVGDVMVLVLKGKMTLGEGDEQLKNKMNSLVNRGLFRVVLNVRGVPYLDSAGLGEVSRSWTTLKQRGGYLKLLHPTRRVMDLLEITKLLESFETFDSEAEAVASFAAKPMAS
jgi:anti-sigma B factor antagonist